MDSDLDLIVILCTDLVGTFGSTSGRLSPIGRDKFSEDSFIFWDFPKTCSSSEDKVSSPCLAPSHLEVIPGVWWPFSGDNLVLMTLDTVMGPCEAIRFWSLSLVSCCCVFLVVFLGDLWKGLGSVLQWCDSEHLSLCLANADLHLNDWPQPQWILRFRCSRLMCSFKFSIWNEHQNMHILTSKDVKIVTVQASGVLSHFGHFCRFHIFRLTVPTYGPNGGPFFYAPGLKSLESTPHWHATIYSNCAFGTVLVSDLGWLV